MWGSDKGAFKSARKEFAQKVSKGGLEDAGREAQKFQVNGGEVIPSIKEALSRIWNKTLGKILPKWHPQGNPEKILGNLKPENATEGFMTNKAAQSKAIKGAGRASFGQRVLSKPFRVAARHPLLAAGAALLFGAKYMSDRHNREQRLETLNNYAAQNPMPQMEMANGYYNSVTPQEYAAMESQMRQSGMQGGFADREMARRAEMEALAAQQGPVA